MCNGPEVAPFHYMFSSWVLMIVVAATTSWVRAESSSSTVGWGLFQVCWVGQCTSTLSLLQMIADPAAAVSQAKAAQAFTVLAILMSSFLVPYYILRTIQKHSKIPTTQDKYPQIEALMDMIPIHVDVILAAFHSFCILIVWTVGLQLRFTICDKLYPSDGYHTAPACEVHFSFIITVIEWVASVYTVIAIKRAQDAQALAAARAEAEQAQAKANLENAQVPPPPALTTAWADHTVTVVTGAPPPPGGVYSVPAAAFPVSAPVIYNVPVNTVYAHHPGVAAGYPGATAYPGAVAANGSAGYPQPINVNGLLGANQMAAQQPQS